MSLSIDLYIDNFEICNHLRTKLTSFVLCWDLGSMIPGSNLSLSTIYLATLCRTDDLKAFGFKKVLQPLINGLKRLETDGIFVPLIGKFVKGTVQTIAAGN